MVRWLSQAIDFVRVAGGRTFCHLTLSVILGFSFLGLVNYILVLVSDNSLVQTCTNLQINFLTALQKVRQSQ